MNYSISLSGETLELHPLGAAFWKERKLLLISDLHFGKITHFRKNGAAVPHKAIMRNIERLDMVVTHFNPVEICFLGDLFHSHLNPEWDLFEAWIQSREERFILIRGNHDIISPEKYTKLKIQYMDSWDIAPFVLTHEPEIFEDRYNIAGHIHPAIALAGPGKQRLRLPCFFQRPNQLILPSFGAFTGSFTLIPEPGDTAYVMAEDQIISISEDGIL
jgi:DNA ligase-associated metallophosphoesterase